MIQEQFGLDGISANILSGHAVACPECYSYYVTDYPQTQLFYIMMTDSLGQIGQNRAETALPCFKIRLELRALKQ